jgi:hypothetical protein
MTKAKMIEIFRVGTHTSSSGEVVECTESDLDSIALNFEANPKIPFTIGHPKTDKEPAYGWCNKVVKEGKKLFAEMTFVSETLAGMLKEKLFDNCSIGLKKGWKLDHIALVGAAQPAIKGMEFAEFDNQDIQEFCMGMVEPENKEPKLPWSAKNAFRAIATALTSWRER